MSDLVLIIFLILYALTTLGLIIHSIVFIYLFFIYQRYKNRPLKPAKRFPENELPYQIVQLPIYNENLALVKQLVDSACTLSYPSDRLLIQLLDDSDCRETSARLRDYVMHKKERQPDLNLIFYHRYSREGFKAGNLNFGLAAAKEALQRTGIIDTNKAIISIFDADFIIPWNYLEETVHFFTSSDVGVVQATLEYYNHDSNFITKAQASFLINLHLIDFGSRSRAGHLTTFRGSAGSWRLSAIEEAGCWQGDTQIEDVDMSFAAQLLGWKILYLNHLSVRCQLATSYHEFKLQQRSWMKGLMEVMRKRLGSVIRSPLLSLSQKILVLDFFLILSLQSLFMIVGHLSIIPSYYCLKRLGCPELMGWFTLGLLALLSLTHIPFMSTWLGGGQEESGLECRDWLRFILDRVFSFALVTAMFVTLTYGLLEGIRGVKVHRDRTIKVGPSGGELQLEPTGANQQILVRINRFELVMSIYSLALVGWAFWLGEWLVGFIYGILAVCYPWNAVLSLINLKPRTRPASDSEDQLVEADDQTNKPR